MIVFLSLPMVGAAPADALRAALGDAKTSCLSTSEDAPRERARPRLALLDENVTLAEASALAGVRLFTTLLTDPLARAMAEWDAARAKPSHPHHAIAHTLDVTELVEERHPFADRLTNAMTRRLVPDGAAIDAAAAMKAVQRLPFLIGHTDNPVAYANALARALDLPGDRLDARAFRAPKPTRAQGQVRRALAAINHEDAKLVRAVEGLRRPRERVSWTVVTRKSLAGKTDNA